ncbi:MAG: 4-hydroxy-tetrahydrodipicolinate reductase [Pseudomonadota bacterium]
MTATSIIVAGCSGRMGRAVLSAVHETGGTRLAGGFDRAECAEKGRDLGALIGVDGLGLCVMGSAEEVGPADAMIDFTAPAASVKNATACAATGTAFIVGTTGLSEEDEAAIAAAAEKTVIVKSGNMSLGVNLLSALVERAAAALGEDFDIEIAEMHHRHKVDAPSGTALLLGEAAARGRDIDLASRSVRSRDGITGARQSGDIGFATLRGGGVVGEHSVLFASDTEVLALKHSALDRSLFAKGAVAAAKWAKGKTPGLYSMRDVLGLG